MTDNNNNNNNNNSLPTGLFGFRLFNVSVKKPGNISFLRKHHHTARTHGIEIHSLAHESLK
jgi:hypothetical protein